MDDPLVFDYEGNRRDLRWVADVYGTDLRRAEAAPGEQVYRIVEIREAEGPSVQIVFIYSDQGQPLQDVYVARHWPDAPNELPFHPASAWESNAVVGRTKENGEVGFALGRGDYIFGPGQGVSSLWVADRTIKSDYAGKLGMIAGTNHRRLDFVYHLTTVPADDDGGGEDDGGSGGSGGSGSGGAGQSELAARLTALETRLGEIEAALDNESDTLEERLSAIEDVVQRLRDAFSRLP